MLSASFSWGKNRCSGHRARDDMRILHIIDSSGLYGAEVMLLDLMSEQVRMGHEPILASIGLRSIYEKPVELEARRRGLRVRPFRMRPGPNIPGAFKVLRFAWEERVGVIHSHGYKGNILFGLIPRRIRRVPMVTTIHGWTWTGEINRMLLYEWLDAYSLNFIDRIVLVNRAMQEHPRLKGRSRLVMEIVENGIPVNGTLIDSPQLDNKIVEFCRGGYTVGAIGRLSREKGFDLLVEAVSVLVRKGKNIRLVIMGEGDLRSDLQKRVGKLGLGSHVLLPGYVGCARNYLPYLKMLVVSSLTEGLPIVILEAMLAGVPIVSTSVGGVPEVLQYGKAGILVPPLSVPALADGMACMISNSATAKEMVEIGMESVKARYSATAMAVKYAKIYEEISHKETDRTTRRNIFL
jgi:glycosyltransferase involved in cell wall biosynthesis